MTKLTCRTCRFWDHPAWNLERALAPVTVDCRRHAPDAYPLGEGDDGVGRNAMWPRTQADDWCGDAEPVDEALAAEREEARKRLESSLFAVNGVRNRRRSR